MAVFFSHPHYKRPDVTLGFLTLINRCVKVKPLFIKTKSNFDWNFCENNHRYTYF